MSLARVFYPEPYPHITSLTGVVYVYFDRRATALIGGFWCVKMKTNVWRRKFIISSLFRTAMVLWNPFEKVFTNYILSIFEVTL